MQLRVRRQPRRRLRDLFASYGCRLLGVQPDADSARNLTMSVVCERPRLILYLVYIGTQCRDDWTNYNCRINEYVHPDLPSVLLVEGFAERFSLCSPALEASVVDSDWLHQG